MNSGQNKCAKITALIPEYRALSEFRAQKRRSDCAVLKIADFGPAQGKRGMPIERSTPTIGTTRIFCAAQFKREIPAPLLNVGGESLRGHPNARADREIQVGRGAFARGSIINMVISAHFFCPSFISEASQVSGFFKIISGFWRSKPCDFARAAARQVFSKSLRPLLIPSFFTFFLKSCGRLSVRRSVFWRAKKRLRFFGDSKWQIADFRASQT